MTALWEKPINYFGRRSASTPHTHSTDSALNHLLNDKRRFGRQRHLSEGHWSSASSEVGSKGSGRPYRKSRAPWLWEDDISLSGRAMLLATSTVARNRLRAPTWLLPVPNAGISPRTEFWTSRLPSISQVLVIQNRGHHLAIARSCTLYSLLNVFL